MIDIIAEYPFLGVVFVLIAGLIVYFTYPRFYVFQSPQPGSFNKNLLHPFSIAIPFLLFVILFSRGLNNSSINYPDAGRILMDGVFIADFLRNFPLFNPLEYSLTYYAQYPALSIGYRPPLFPFIESLFIILFGVHTWSGRLALMSMALVGGVSFFLQLTRMYDRTVATIATTLLVTTPFIVSMSWYTLAGIPVLSMTLVTSYFVWRFAEGDGDRFIYWAAICFALAVWTKLTAIFLFLWFIPYFLISQRRKEIFINKAFFGAMLLFLVLIMPLVAMTLYMGDLNIAQSIGENPRGSQLPRWHWDNLTFYPLLLQKSQLTTIALVLSVFGLLIAFIKKDRGCLFFLILLIATYIFFTMLNDPHLVRYTIYWIPAFCVFSAIPLTYIKATIPRFIYLVVVIATLLFNIQSAYTKTPKYISGFEKAAQYVIQNNKTKTLLIDSWNNGYFTFFIRANDPGRRLFVFRGDKLFSSSATESTTWTTVHAKNEEEIKNKLSEYNINLLVVEEKDYTGIKIHQVFRDMLKGEDFELKASFPIESNLPRYHDQNLNVYEFKKTLEKQAGDLVINIPIIGKSIRIRNDGKPPELLKFKRDDNNK